MFENLFISSHKLKNFMSDEKKIETHRWKCSSVLRHFFKLILYYDIPVRLDLFISFILLHSTSALLCFVQNVPQASFFFLFNRLCNECLVVRCVYFISVCLVGQTESTETHIFPPLFYPFWCSSSHCFPLFAPCFSTAFPACCSAHIHLAWLRVLFHSWQRPPLSLRLFFCKYAVHCFLRTS